MMGKRLGMWVVVVLALLVGRAVAAEPTAAFTNSIGIEFVLIPAGSFKMGGDKVFDGDVTDNELPLHQVTISKPFYMGKHEVTQIQWVTVMGSNPSRFKGRDNPVEMVSWADAQEFITKLNNKEKTASYRLPTEAEWEYAARAGTATSRYWSDGEDGMEEYAWFRDNSQRKTHPVGQLKANRWGLYDMLGNVYEWVQDWYHDDYYAKSPATDPAGPAVGAIRISRGGGWENEAATVRTPDRHHFEAGARRGALGFRLVKTVH